MSFLSRLLRYATKEDLAGVRLETRERWIVPPTRDVVRFLRSLPILFPASAFVYFEGTTERELTTWLEAHSIAPPLKIALGTIWPKPNFHHLPLRLELLDEVVGLIERNRIGIPSYHLHVHDGARVVLEWHDAFCNDPLYVATSVPRERVEEFARVLGVGQVARAVAT
jgi:hypothetical protein